jgi:prepilin-type N-terminal cleavage/methylation domain-containing protein
MMSRFRTAIDRRRAVSGGRAGFTLVEMLITVGIVGILAGLAIPNLRTVLLRARATELAGDMEVVRVATQSYIAELSTWPAEAGTGTIPSGLDRYLPEGFSIVQDGYSLDFENWSVPGGLPGDPGTSRVIGVSVVVDDPQLGNALIELLGSTVVFSVGNTHTVLIDRS